jgi:hypothetical protein
MNGNFSDTNASTPCWIYILQGESNAEYQIGYTMKWGRDMARNGRDVACRVSTNEGKLMYLRMFDDFVDAFGHKLFLENISTRSLRRFVRMHNPDLNDLRETILSTGDNATNEATTVRIDNYNNTK